MSYVTQLPQDIARAARREHYVGASLTPEAREERLDYLRNCYFESDNIILDAVDVAGIDVLELIDDVTIEWLVDHYDFYNGSEDGDEDASEAAEGGAQ